MIEKMLTLSTAHMPSPDADFGEFRVVDDEYGYIVCIYSVLSDDLPDGEVVPVWLRPIIAMAMTRECRYIYFDRDVPTIDELRTWEW